MEKRVGLKLVENDHEVSVTVGKYSHRTDVTVGDRVTGTCRTIRLDYADFKELIAKVDEKLEEAE